MCFKSWTEGWLLNGSFFPSSRLIRLWLTASVSGQQSLSLTRAPVVREALTTLSNVVVVESSGSTQTPPPRLCITSNTSSYYVLFLPGMTGVRDSKADENGSSKGIFFYTIPLGEKACTCQKLGKPERTEERNKTVLFHHPKKIAIHMLIYAYAKFFLTTYACTRAHTHTHTFLMKVES